MYYPISFHDLVLTYINWIYIQQFRLLILNGTQFLLSVDGLVVFIPAYAAASASVVRCVSTVLTVLGMISVVVCRLGRVEGCGRNIDGGRW
jgi:small-conductance mechanosensitive channel